MRLIGWIAGLCAAALVAGCGGGGGGTTLSATVTAVTSDVLSYSKTAHFTVAGQNLDRGITMVAPDCSGIAQATGGTSTQVVFTCKPTVSGVLAVAIKGTDGTSLLSTNFAVSLPQVTLKTSMGDVVVELYPNNAPITVSNFVQYVTDGFYTNKIFHRIVKDFVVQGGGFDSTLQAATTRAAIKLEVPNGLSNLRGTIAMARTSVLDSATSQFYFNVVDNITLDTSGGGYAVFGKVITGLALIDAMNVVPTQTVGAFTNVPVTPIVITSATQTQ